MFGPLGNGFRLDVPRPLLVGGGIGIAPFPYLSEALERPPAMLGFRSGRARRGGGARPERRGRDRPGARHRRDAAADRDVLACGPEPMLEAVRALVPAAQLAWEAPMACGYGACYGCVVRVDGRARPPLRRRAGAVLLLNASGCLDALDRARGGAVARRLRDEDRHARAARGNPPVRIAETDAGMLNSIGLANPGRERFLAETLPALRALGLPLWVSVGGFSAREYAETCAAAATESRRSS